MVSALNRQPVQALHIFHASRLIPHCPESKNRHTTLYASEHCLIMLRYAGAQWTKLGSYHASGDVKISLGLEPKSRTSGPL